MKTAKKENIDLPREVKLGKPEKKPKVELVSYSIKMVIPTGQYANIQPEIIVKAGTVEEAHNYIAPHMNKLWKEYYLVSERRPEVKVNNDPQQAPKPVPEAQRGVPGVQVPTNQQIPPAPDSSVAFTKATQAITSCLSIEALDLIEGQIDVSVKLTPDDKLSLRLLLIDKRMELNG